MRYYIAGKFAFFIDREGNTAPPYNGASVFVPFVNATAVSDPSQYVSPQIRVGFNSPNATGAYPVFNVTMDTGSVGIIAGSSYFNPPADGRLNPSFIAPGSETLTSSGIIFTGDWYKTIVNLYNGNSLVASSTVPVMAVTTVSCEQNARVCNPSTIASTAPATHYFGIGFAGGAGQPQGTPDKNAFLNVTSIAGSGLLPSPGYILSTQGVQIGLTSSNTQGFALIKLEPVLAPNSTQWQTAPASRKCADRLATCAGDDHGEWKIGQRRHIVRYRRDDGLFNAAHRRISEHWSWSRRRRVQRIEPAELRCKRNQSSGFLSGQSNAVASFSYTVGANNGAQSGNPVSPFAVSVEQNSAPFLNTTVRFLQAFNYIYDAANGFIGLKTTGNTPAQYAANTASGLAVGGVFQCFFSWAEANFVSASNGSQSTKYSWPYTYRYALNMHGLRPDPAYVGVSSGSPASGNTAATNANNVYILGADGQSTDEGALSGWLAAAGCQ